MIHDWAYPKVSPAVKRQLSEIETLLKALDDKYRPCRLKIPVELTEIIAVANEHLEMCRMKACSMRNHMMHHSQLMTASQ